MIRCNLAIILAEQGLKITKVSTDTGISRTTLTSLANNYSQGVQLDTINILCTYLGIKPNDLICHIPIEIDITGVKINSINPIEFVYGNDEANNASDFPNCIFDVQLIENSSRYNYQLNCLCFIGYTKQLGIRSVSVVVDLTIPPKETPTTYLVKTLNHIPRPFLTDVENSMINAIFEFYGGAIEKNDIIISWKNDI